MQKRCALYAAGVLLFGLSAGTAVAQRRHHESDTARPVAPCFDPGDRSEVRLWDGAAPGASGDDPCRDIPFLRVFPAARANNASPAILVMPGGGYDRLTNEKEQEPVAEYFSKRLGVTTFLVYYRLVQKDGTYRYPVPMWDGQRAIKLVRSRATQFGIDPEKLGLFGFSAGGHLASTLTLHSASDFGLPTHDGVDAESGRPTLLGLGYPVISMDPKQFAATNSHNHLLTGYRGHELDRLETYLSGQENVKPSTVPVFLFESMDDARISPQNSVLFGEALQAAHVPAQVKLFAHGRHGAGLATDEPEESAWPEMFHRWLVTQGFLAR
ncbi:MAG: alpha/beta hydrolase [Verrucomicrobium sp.]|nr:alpha/beta hydrolase [Verrucomicrobium sp.]